jgi:hypothetical protein
VEALLECLIDAAACQGAAAVEREMGREVASEMAREREAK